MRLDLKRVLVENFSYEDEFDLHENEPAGATNFQWFRTETRFEAKARRQIQKWCIAVN